MNITNDIYNIGVKDNKIDLFEGQYQVPNGMLYNSYIIIDEKVAILDTVESNYKDEWIHNFKSILKDRQPDYLFVHHMEPDHSSSIKEFLNLYPDVKIVASKQAFVMIHNFYKLKVANQIVVKEGDELSLGRHTLKFISTPMIHWPEVIMSYESYDKVLFSSDAFGKFGTNNNVIDWENEARRYYFGIVGKYGPQVQLALKKVKDLDIKYICSLHGPVLHDELNKYLSLYNIWSNYEAEANGITIAYTSMYGNTRQAALLLKDKLIENGLDKVDIFDLARCDIFEAVSKAFKNKTLILATTTYNNNIFPYMRTFIQYLLDRNYQKRQIAFIENGSWAPNANKIMKEMFNESKDIQFLNTSINILSSLNDNNIKQIDMLIEEIKNN